MSPKEALAFVKERGVVLQAAHSSIPSLAEALAIAGVRDAAGEGKAHAEPGMKLGKV